MASEQNSKGDGKVVDLKKGGAAATQKTDGSNDTQDNNTRQSGETTLPSNPGKAEKALQIRAKGERFRRAGLSFGHEPSVHKLSDLSEEQIAALKAEPQLVVEEIEI